MNNMKLLEIKPCGLGSKIRDVEAFWHKTEILYFVPLCWLCVIDDCMVYFDPKFLIFKTKKSSFFFWSWRLIFFDPMLSRKFFKIDV